MKYFIPIGDWPLNIKPYHNLMEKLGWSEGNDNNSDVLILTGGSDIGLRKNRDSVEINYYAKWVFEKKPILGICRGMQLMFHINDCDLIQHIPDYSNDYMHTTISGDWRGQSSWHTTELGLLTNSRHHQGFADAPSFWTILDKTDDGVIESAMSKLSLFQFGVQWHPEHNEMNNTNAQDWWIETVKQNI